MTDVERVREHSLQKKIKDQVLGPGDAMGEGDTSLVLDVLPPDLEAEAMDRLRKEVKWNVMMHRGGEVPRLVAVEGGIAEDGSYPIYRHPADSSPSLLPFSPIVSQIRTRVEQILNHPVNHVLIQYYRTGKDYISEHSDKTIDVVRGSKIVNVSIGATRTMTMRTKKDGSQGEEQVRKTQKIPLPNNSMFVMGLNTNAKWLHSIRHDNRPFNTKSVEEQYMNGERISLTFRRIGTFLSEDGKKIWGQGAKGKTKEEAQDVLVGAEQEVESLIEKFGRENHQSDFDWDEAYGEGSNVLHFVVTSNERKV